jgi:hypothetical protein
MKAAPVPLAGTAMPRPLCIVSYTVLRTLRRFRHIIGDRRHTSKRDPESLAVGSGIGNGPKGAERSRSRFGCTPRQSHPSNGIAIQPWMTHQVDLPSTGNTTDAHSSPRGVQRAEACSCLLQQICGLSLPGCCAQSFRKANFISSAVAQTCPLFHQPCKRHSVLPIHMGSAKLHCLQYRTKH